MNWTDTQIPIPYTDTNFWMRHDGFSLPPRQGRGENILAHENHPQKMFP